jgi:hypothetical protein
MRTSIGFMVIALAAAATAYASELPKDQVNCDTPLVRTVTPDKAATGVEVTVAGDSLGKACVSGLFLTTAAGDVQVPLLSQNGTTIRFKIPANLKPGRFGLALLNGDKSRIIDEPVWLVLE